MGCLKSFDELDLAPPKFFFFFQFMCSSLMAWSLKKLIEALDNTKID
jgi:hypothetical protein